MKDKIFEGKGRLKYNTIIRTYMEVNLQFNRTEKEKQTVQQNKHL